MEYPDRRQRPLSPSVLESGTGPVPRRRVSFFLLVLLSRLAILKVIWYLENRCFMMREKSRRRQGGDIDSVLCRNSSSSFARSEERRHTQWLPFRSATSSTM
jgi:hypothetical protein